MLTRTYRGIEGKGLLGKVEAGEHTAGAVGEFAARVDGIQSMCMRMLMAFRGVCNGG
jgi:hypothetical protein